MTLRRTIFWIHLVAGIVAGVVIAIMSFTGVALAYEKQIIAWAERDVRRPRPPPDPAEPLPLDALLARVQASRPEARSASVTVSADRREAVLFSFGRTNAIYANPYTGEIHPQGAVGIRAFMRCMIDWHRYLGARGDGRPMGKAVTGAGNAVFLVLGITGLYLWWPRRLTREVLRAVAVMHFDLRGKARDWNWHNAVGFWTAPVLIVLTATAMPISYRWAGDLIYTLTGTEAPAAGSGPGAGPTVGSAVGIAQPSPDARPLGLESLIGHAEAVVPGWQTVTVRANSPPGRGGGASGDGPRREGVGSGVVQPVVVIVKERNAWPLFSSVQLTLNPYTGEVIRREGYADQNAGRRVRSWTRFLHTGEALGLIGQGIAALASLGALVLVWTGFALAWRRFLPRTAAASADRPGGGA